jgi:hypothetical protein
MASGTLWRARAWTRSLDFGDLTALVERDFAAFGQELAKLRAGSLHPGLHAGHREADQACGLHLGEIAQVG